MSNETLAITEMDRETLNAILELAAEARLEIIRPPRTGLRIMKVLDSCDTQFFLGEVLVTEAEVALDGQRGYAMVTGDLPERALARACAEAILSSENSGLKEKLSEVLGKEESRLRARRCREEELTARTRVSFDLMPGN